MDLYWVNSRGLQIKIQFAKYSHTKGNKHWFVLYGKTFQRTIAHCVQYNTKTRVWTYIRMTEESVFHRVSTIQAKMFSRIKEMLYKDSLQLLRNKILKWWLLLKCNGVKDVSTYELKDIVRHILDVVLNSEFSVIADTRCLPVYKV